MILFLQSHFYGSEVYLMSIIEQVLNNETIEMVISEIDVKIMEYDNNNKEVQVSGILLML